jgi:hypothetical protein
MTGNSKHQKIKVQKLEHPVVQEMYQKATEEKYQQDYTRK